MIHRAVAQNAPEHAARNGAPHQSWPNLRYTVLDAEDPTFRVDPPVDLVIAMYLLHDAPSEDDLTRMANLIARNLRPGGRFVTYTLSPDCDFRRHEPRMMARCGFDYAALGGPHCELIIGEKRVDIWQWSRAVHGSCLRSASLAEIRWHPLEAPPNAPEVRTAMDFYLANPSCIVLSACKLQ
jgi:toxoflavin synthase